MAPWADVLYACDPKWWDTHYEEVSVRFKGRLMSQYNASQWESKAKFTGPTQGRIECLPGNHNHGLGELQLHYGNNSGYQAVNLAYILGAARILLLGYNLGPVGGSWHFFGHHPKHLREQSPWDKFIRSFKTIDPKFYGIEIINCTLDSHLKHFPIRRLDDVI